MIMLLVFSFVACSPSIDSPGHFIDEAANRFGGQVSGMSIKVFTGDRILFENFYGYANEAEDLVIDSDTVFKWGSITKSLVWISVLQLSEQGKLDLHTGIRAYIPNNFLPDLKYPTTTYNLMTHSSGFLEEDFWISMIASRVQANEDRQQTIIDFTLRNIEMSQRFKPGDLRGDYSHYNVILASYIVEQVSGMPFYQYVHNNIFSRLGMAYSAIRHDLSDNIWVAERLAGQACYSSSDRRIEAVCFPIHPPIYWMGGAISTISDFYKFAHALLPTAIYYGDRGAALFEKSETLFKLHNIMEYEIAAYTDSANGIVALNGQMCQTATILVDVERGLGVVVMTNQQAEGFFNRVTFLREVIDRFYEWGNNYR